MKISQKGLHRWKKNSLSLALKMGLDEHILLTIEQNVRLSLIEGFPENEMLYGWCFYHKTRPKIEVYTHNLSTENSTTIISALRAKKIPEKDISNIMRIYEKIGARSFFEIYNQSGMDHELIGHLYNYLAQKNCDEKEAVMTQIAFAKKRSGLIWGRNWRHILEIMPLVLAYHKNIDELK